MCLVSIYLRFIRKNTIDYRNGSLSSGNYSGLTSCRRWGPKELTVKDQEEHLIGETEA